MPQLVIAFTLAFVVLALAVSHMIDVISGNETDIGLPAGFDGITQLFGVLLVIVASGILLAPFAAIAQSKRSRSRRRERI